MSKKLSCHLPMHTTSLSGAAIRRDRWWQSELCALLREVRVVPPRSCGSGPDDSCISLRHRLPEYSVLAQQIACQKHSDFTQRSHSPACNLDGLITWYTFFPQHTQRGNIMPGINTLHENGFLVFPHEFAEFVRRGLFSRAKILGK